MSKRHIVFVPGKNPKPEAEYHRDLLWRTLVEGVRRIEPETASELVDNEDDFQFIDWNYIYYLEHDDIDTHLPYVEEMFKRDGPSDEDIKKAQAWRHKLEMFIYNTVDSTPVLLRLLRGELKETAEETNRYFDNEEQIASEIREQLKKVLRPLLADGGKVMIIGHSMGSVITYDTLWTLSQLEHLPGKVDMFLTLGLIFVIVGIAFKLGAAPFHMWVPDVYEGAPTATTLFIASAPKIAAFALAMRMLGQGLDVLMVHWQSMLATLAIVSIVIGNLFALQQTNLKRLFAYSTISHIGFMLLGLVGGQDGYAASMLYIIVYTVMAVGGFGMIVLLSNKGYEADSIDDFKGLNQRNGWYAFMMLLLVGSMAGFPPLIGFFSKLYVLKAVVDQGYIGLAVVAVIFAVIGAFYYLRIIKVMYFDESETDQAISANIDVKTVLSINALAQLGLLIILPALFNYCIQVTQAF